MTVPPLKSNDQALYVMNCTSVNIDLTLPVDVRFVEVGVMAKLNPIGVAAVAVPKLTKDE